MNYTTPQHEMPLLGGIAALIRWVEELVSLLAGPLLTVGLGISLVDLLTDGALLSKVPVLQMVWAVSQAIGVDAQLVASFDRARVALREKRYWSLLGLLFWDVLWRMWLGSRLKCSRRSKRMASAHHRHWLCSG